MLQKLLATLLMAASMSAFADLSASNGRDSVVLHKDACSVPTVVANVPKDLLPELKNGEAYLNGTKFQLCWTIYQGAVALIYEDGDTGFIPMSEFKERGV